MKKALLVVALCVLFSISLCAQIKIQEGFENTDSIPPPGWGVYNQASFFIDPVTNWTVRDTSRVTPLPGLTTGRAKAHSGSKAIGVSWTASLDTNGVGGIADAWLVTPRVRNVAVGDTLRFWASGGTTIYGDSLQIWILGTDSLPSTSEFHLASIIWPPGSTYGQFSEYVYDLSGAAGIDIWIGFRYTGDLSGVYGFFVHVDDVLIGGPTSVRQINSLVPELHTLSQNYPNPFNPSTSFEFALPTIQHVTLKIFNTMGEEVSTLVNETLSPGTYTSQWDASGLASGMYFYRLQTGDFVQTKRMLLVK